MTNSRAMLHIHRDITLTVHAHSRRTHMSATVRATEAELRLSRIDTKLQSIDDSRRNDWLISMPSAAAWLVPFIVPSPAVAPVLGALALPVIAKAFRYHDRDRTR